MLNLPLFYVGSQLVLTGSDESVADDGYYYSYTEDEGSGDYSSITETYTYSSSGLTDYTENFFYSAEDGVVDFTSTSYQYYFYDSSDRLDRTNWVSLSVYEEYDMIAYSSSSSYVYENRTGYELDYSVTTYASAYTDSLGNTSGLQVTTTESDYAYLETPSSVDDFYQRRDSTLGDNGGDGVIDFSSYSLTTQTEDSYTFVSVGYNSSNEATFSSVYHTETASIGTGSSSLNYNSFASDSDGDGLIDASGSYSGESSYDSSGNLIFSTFDSIYKNDTDLDGSADFINLSKSMRNQSAGKMVTYTWESAAGAKKGELTIEKSFDLDGDYLYEKVSEKSISYDPSSSYLLLGDQVATYEDTLMA